MIFVVDPPADPAPSAGDAAQDAAPDVSSAIVPEDLVSIRAYVRWEEAGMPEDTTPEWQATEFARARLDLQMEVLDGLPQRDPPQVQPDPRPRRRRAPVPQDSRRGHRADEEQRRRAGAPPPPPRPSPEKRGRCSTSPGEDPDGPRGHPRVRPLGGRRQARRHASRVATRRVRDGSSGSADRGALGRLPQRHSPQVQPDSVPGDDAAVRRLGRLGGAAPGQEDARRSRRASSSRLRTGRTRGSRGVVRARNPRLSESTWRRVAAIREGSSPSFAATTASYRALEALDVLGQMGERGSSPNGPSRPTGQADVSRR